jgi:hypothetical protein
VILLRLKYIIQEFSIFREYHVLSYSHKNDYTSWPRTILVWIINLILGFCGGFLLTPYNFSDKIWRVITASVTGGFTFIGIPLLIYLLSPYKYPDKYEYTNTWRTIIGITALIFILGCAAYFLFGWLGWFNSSFMIQSNIWWRYTVTAIIFVITPLLSFIHGGIKTLQGSTENLSLYYFVIRTGLFFCVALWAGILYGNYRYEQDKNDYEKNNPGKQYPQYTTPQIIVWLIVGVYIILVGIIVYIIITMLILNTSSIGQSSVSEESKHNYLTRLSEDGNSRRHNGNGNGNGRGNGNGNGNGGLPHEPTSFTGLSNAPQHGGQREKYKKYKKYKKTKLM